MQHLLRPNNQATVAIIHHGHQHYWIKKKLQCQSEKVKGQREEEEEEADEGAFSMWT